MIHNILFDLDGTLTDPGEGITRSAQYALAHFGIQVENHRELESFIGPPLTDSFEERFGIKGADGMAAVEKFREYFKDKGIHQNLLYPGIPQCLQALKNQGRTLYLATSKPTFFALQVLENFQLSAYFTDVEGSPLEHPGVAKADIIAALMQRHNLPADKTIMVGDRKHDIIGANKNGLASVGVLYGYGSREEFESYGATYIVPTVQQLGTLLASL